MTRPPIKQSGRDPKLWPPTAVETPPHDQPCRCEPCAAWRAAARRGLTWDELMDSLDDLAFQRVKPDAVQPAPLSPETRRVVDRLRRYLKGELVKE